MPRRLAVLLTLALAAVAPPVAAAATERPIVYAVVIDGLDGDRIDEGKAPFISSLLNGQGARSTYFPESRSVMLAETNPNHTAMMSGAFGGQSGIPGNAFALYQPIVDQDSCETTGPVDLTMLPNATSGENANCPIAEFVFEAVKRQGDPDGLLTAAIFGKPKLGRIFAGSRSGIGRRDVDHLWAPCDSGSDDDDYCGKVPLNPANGYALDDATVMSEVLRTVRVGVDGQGAKRRPDFTFVNLHQVDSAGHGSGTGAGYDAAILQADREIQRLVDELRRRGEWDRTVMVLLSDHSMDTTLSKTTLTRSFEDAGAVAEKDFLVVQNGSADLVYLANRTDPGRFALLKRLRAAALANANVTEVLYREPNPEDGGMANTLEGAHQGYRLAGERTGDLVVFSKPGAGFSDPSSTSNPLPGNHGGPQTRDNFLAVLGGSPAIRQGRVAGSALPGFDDTLANPQQAENVDAASTVLGVLGLAPTRDNAGRFLSEAFDLGALPGGGVPSLAPKFSIRRLPARPPLQRLRLVIDPRHLPLDIEADVGGVVKKLNADSMQSGTSFRARTTKPITIRMRALSAAGVAGPFVSQTLKARTRKR